MAKQVATAAGAAHDQSAPSAERRTIIKAAVCSGLGCLVPAAGAQPDPRNSRPLKGDRFVFAGGERKGQLIRVDDVPVAANPVLGYPQDPSTGLVRDGSRLNQVLFMRFDAAQFKDGTKPRVAQGVVAYSGICTHMGCDAWAWIGDRRMLLCPCHDSQFDPLDAARVEVGPATRRLAALPLEVADGALVAAGEFVGRVGAVQQ